MGHRDDEIHRVLQAVDPNHGRDRRTRLRAFDDDRPELLRVDAVVDHGDPIIGDADLPLPPAVELAHGVHAVREPVVQACDGPEEVRPQDLRREVRGAIDEVEHALSVVQPVLREDEGHVPLHLLDDAHEACDGGNRRVAHVRRARMDRYDLEVPAQGAEDVRGLKDVDVAVQLVTCEERLEQVEDLLALERLLEVPVAEVHVHLVQAFRDRLEPAPAVDAPLQELLEVREEVPPDVSVPRRDPSAEERAVRLPVEFLRPLLAPERERRDTFDVRREAIAELNVRVRDHAYDLEPDVREAPDQAVRPGRDPAHVMRVHAGDEEEDLHRSPSLSEALEELLELGHVLPGDPHALRRGGPTGPRRLPHPDYGPEENVRYAVRLVRMERRVENHELCPDFLDLLPLLTEGVERRGAFEGPKRVPGGRLDGLVRVTTELPGCAAVTHGREGLFACLSENKPRHREAQRAPRPLVPEHLLPRVLEIAECRLPEIPLELMLDGREPEVPLVCDPPGPGPGHFLRDREVRSPEGVPDAGPEASRLFGDRARRAFR